MFVTIPDSLIREALRSPGGAGALYGRLRDEGDVAQVRGLDPEFGDELGRWVAGAQLPGEIERAIPALVTGQIFVSFSAEPQPKAQAYRLENQQLQPVQIDIIRLHADYTARLNGLFEPGALADARVAVIGLGSGGSVVATQLARCGVGHMRLVDPDRLETHNIARHVCGLRDIGRYKTRAVRDLLRDISPIVAVETYEADILARPEILAEVVAGCDLVVAATDTEESKLAINAACWPLGIPAVYGAAYNRAFGGDVFRALPPDGACYDCFQQVVVEHFGPPPPAASDFSPGYADPARMADLIAEPGLAMDVGVIALLLARVALMVLLRGQATTLPDLPENWLLFGNRAGWIFEKPLESLFIDVPKRPDCPTCNYEGYVREHLGMSADEVRAAAEALLAQLLTTDPPAPEHT